MNTPNNNNTSVQRLKQVGHGGRLQNTTEWNQLQTSFATVKPTEDSWLIVENVEERFENEVTLIGDQENYAHDEYVREWLAQRFGPLEHVTEPLLWQLHRFDPPAFVISNSDWSSEKMLLELLRVFRHPYKAYRHRSICIFVEKCDLQNLVHKLNNRKISVVVLEDNHNNAYHGTNAVFVATNARHVGPLPLDNLINYQMFRSANQYMDRHRLLRRRGHMTTFFNPVQDSQLVPNLVQEMRKRKIDIPAFLKHRSGEITEYIRR